MSELNITHQNHRSFMQEHGFEAWLEEAQAKAFDRPIAEVRKDLKLVAKKAEADRRRAARETKAK